jgi:hypothetical protein
MAALAILPLLMLPALGACARDPEPEQSCTRSCPDKRPLPILY